MPGKWEDVPVATGTSTVVDWLYFGMMLLVQVVVGVETVKISCHCGLLLVEGGVI